MRKEYELVVSRLVEEGKAGPPDWPTPAFLADALGGAGWPRPVPRHLSASMPPLPPRLCRLPPVELS